MPRETELCDICSKSRRRMEYLYIAGRRAVLCGPCEVNVRGVFRLFDGLRVIARRMTAEELATEYPPEQFSYYQPNRGEYDD